MEVLVEDLAGFVRALSPSGEPVVVVGESFGGALSLSFALAHPELVRGLVIVNSFAHFRPQYRLRAAILGTRLMPWGTMAVIRRVTAFRMHSRHTPRSELRRFMEETRRTTRQGYLNRLRILMHYDALPHLHRITVPTLFLAADEDHLIPSVEQARLMAARIPDSRVQVLEGYGHVCLIAPDLDLEAVIRDWGALNGRG
jgi:3-oxoadipate enol-lactonase